MHRKSQLVTAGAVALAAAVAGVGVQASPANAKPIKDQYIVTLKQDADAQDVTGRAGAKAKKVYKHALNGFAAELNEQQLARIKADPNVEAVEQDEVVTADVTQTMAVNGGLWGLDRVDQRTRPLNGRFFWNKDGTKVRAYILDTGLQANHPEFKDATGASRALNMFNATSGGAADCNGHGTHVAGTVGGRTYGVSKNVLLRGVKVLSGDCSRNGTWSDVIEGLDYVRAHAIRPAVVNMSLGGGKSPAVNAAIRAVNDSGIFVAAAAGNENRDACLASPASESTAFAVAASTKSDAKASYSNHGPCVEIYAPGDGVQSSLLAGSSGTLNGTSMASPHVAGTGALLCTYGSQYCTPSSIRSWILNSATTGLITGNPAGTPNRLLFKGAL